MKYLFLILASVTSFACSRGDDSNGALKKENTNKLVESFNLIDSYGVPLRKNQYVYSNRSFVDPDDSSCAYTVDAKSFLREENQDTIQVNYEENYTADKSNAATCKNPGELNKIETQDYKKSDFISSTQDKMRLAADADYRCKKTSGCEVGVFISKETVEFDGHTYDKYTTETGKLNGRRVILEAYLTRLSYFEGVVQWVTYDKESKKVLGFSKLTKSSIY